MNTEIENIIRDNDYSELNSEQLAAVNEWASTEEEYSTMRQIIASAPLLNEGIAPSPKLKASLMESFAAAHATTPVAAGASSKTDKKVIFFWMRGAAAAIAAILLVIFMVYPLFNSEKSNDLVADNKKETKQPAINETPEKEKPSANAEVKEDIEGVTESHVQVAEVVESISVSRIEADPTSFEEVNASSTLTFNSGGNASPIITNGAFGYTTNASGNSTILEDSNLGFTDGSTFDEDMVGDAPSFEHSDRISVADLPERSRQVLHEQPELLDLLHTTF